MTTQELIKQMIERCGVIEETTDAYFLILAAQRLREQATRITELAAQLEAAKKDAERYAKHCRNPQVAAWCGLDPNATDVLVKLDGFIDAAIAEGKA